MSKTEEHAHAVFAQLEAEAGRIERILADWDALTQEARAQAMGTYGGGLVRQAQRYVKAKDDCDIERHRAMQPPPVVEILSAEETARQWAELQRNGCTVKYSPMHPGDHAGSRVF